MGKLQGFEITFDKNKVMYSPGESISGTVTIKLGQPLQCKGESPLPLRLFRQHLRTWWENVAAAEQGSSGLSQDYMGCSSGLSHYGFTGEIVYLLLKNHLNVDLVVCGALCLR